LLILQNKANYLFINLFLVIIKNKLKIILHLWQYLRKNLDRVANTIKDDFIKKYVLEYFLEKIAELTPHSNQNKKKFYVKKTKSLDSTKKYFNESQSITGVELKEFSLLYLLLNYLSFFQANTHLVENIKLFTEINKQIFNSIIE
jgi:DNA primase